MNSYFVDLKNGVSVMVCADEFKIIGLGRDNLSFKLNGSIVMSVFVEYVLQVVQLTENDNYVKVF